MPTTAKAVYITQAGDPEVLALNDLEVRDPGAGEVLVEVAAAGLNRADLLQRRGVYPAPPGVAADVPGLEFAGRVARLGQGVRAFQIGDEVMGIAAGGAMATHLVAHEGELIAVPAGLDLVRAAAVPEVFLTAYDALFLQGGLRLGSSALIHAVGSGVGTAALQLCLAASCTPIGTSRDTSKLERCRAMGLAHAIHTQDGSFCKKLAELQVPPPAVILDTVGAKYLVENLKSVAPQGRVVVIGLLGGAKAELPLGLLLAKRAHLVGSVLRSRRLDEKIALTQAFAREVAPLFDAGKLEPIIEDVLPMSQVATAHARLETNQVFGKLVLRW